MLLGEDEEPAHVCTCNPCFCETPPGGKSPINARSKMAMPEDEFPEEEEISYIERAPAGFKLDEFMRAKEYFMQASTISGLTVYDHLSEVIRKLLDFKGPPNPVDYVEEISMNVKRYRFGMKKDLMRNTPTLVTPEMLKDSKDLVDSWKKHALWSAENIEIPGEDKPSFGGFPNLLRLLYYLEQINVGLPREEMFRVALSIRQLIITKPIVRARFWGKIMGLYKNYYIVEAELEPQSNDEAAIWVPPPIEEESFEVVLPPMPIEPDAASFLVPGAGETFEKAGFSVTSPEILTPYQETSGLPLEQTAIIIPKQVNAFESEYYGEAGEGGLNDLTYDNPEAAKEQLIWQQYQIELMSGFPIAPTNAEIIEAPSEPKGTGINRRTFYVCNDLKDEWKILPEVTPQQINVARQIRWFLTGNLENKIKTLPAFPGLEGHYLRAQLARITAGAIVSPRGYFRTRKFDAELEDDEDEDDELLEEEEDEEKIGDDTVYPMKKYKPPPMARLLNPSMEVWVHHTSYILRQGRVTWWNPVRPQKKEQTGESDDEELEDEEEDEELERLNNLKEIGPPLFKSLAEDKSLDGTSPWTTRASSTVFTEFQVAAARSNLWPGSTAMCTSKGKVENIYFGDGLKFAGHTYSPNIPEETLPEYKEGPELQEVSDPTVEVEQAWLKKLQLKEIADIEDKFVDNEDEEEGDETEAETTDEDE